MFLFCGLKHTPNLYPDNNFGAAVWSAIESNIRVICASLPHFKPLINRFFPSLMGRSRGPSKTIPLHHSSVTFTLAKRSYMGTYGRTDHELEDGTSWTKPYSGNSGSLNHKCSATAGSGTPFNSSEEHLRGEGTQNKGGGIFTPTSVMISHV